VSFLSIAFEGLDGSTSENSSVVPPMNFALLRGLNSTGMPALVCDLSGAEPTAATVDALARLALSLKRRGSRLRIRRAPPELLELIAYMGLTEALGVEPGR
jgi:hypothetical protein